MTMMSQLKFATLATAYTIELPEEPWYMQEFLYVPLIVWIAVIISLAIIAVYYGVMKR
jgi:hypothetical protein